jgi:hypothetical protein
MFQCHQLFLSFSNQSNCINFSKVFLGLFVFLVLFTVFAKTETVQSQPLTDNIVPAFEARTFLPIHYCA